MATSVVNFDDDKCVSKTHLRYFDIGHVSLQHLLPIDGYQNFPLLQLEDAVESVQLLINDIKTKALIAKKNCQQPKGNLTSNESAAIQLYTMEWYPRDQCLYVMLNKTLRSKERDQLKPWFPYLKLLMTALWKIPSIQCTVWRGIHGSNLSDEYDEGQCYTWWNVSSCTDSLTLMKSPTFLGDKGLRTLFNIECKQGKAIQTHSYFKEESEVLLMPGFYFKVTGKFQSGDGLNIIQLCETAPDYELIKPPFPNQTPLTLPSMVQSQLHSTIHTTTTETTIPITSVRKQSTPRSAKILPNGTSPTNSIKSSYSLDESTTSLTDEKQTKHELSLLKSKQSPLTELTITTTAENKQCPPKPTNTKKKEIISTVTTKKNDFPLIKTVKNVSDPISKKVEEIHQNLHDPILDLVKISLTNEELKLITNTLLYNTTRIKVDLTQTKLKGYDISLITELLTTNQTITELNLSRNSIEDNGSIEISNILKFSKYLKILNIGSNQISQQGILKIADTLTTNKILNSLNIESNPIGNLGIKYICHTLSSNQHLTTLNIWKTEINNDGAEFIAIMLTNNQTLTYLQMGCNKIDDKGIKLVANALKKNKILTNLLIGYCEIGIKGAKYLAEIFQTNSTLMVLDLCHNQIMDDGAIAIIDALNLNDYSYMELDITRNDISNECLMLMEQFMTTENHIIINYKNQN
ncbi:unnamed protein product [Didymodactylos carnosus]|uniref:NAD(P)(+)--arginine ADP-ribosyltransferase n=1 Tax=Didymodactylos carnosus TaxID=1234261 RepID=A0A814SEZ8_9BILA|nr:unnamed protein product [Didymodactylos carnosus]CAF3910031.1 unnamed protein product [Didymodactylos carnosus]